MATTSLGFPIFAGADPNVLHYDFVEALTGNGESSFVNLADAEIVKRSVRHAMSSNEWAASDVVMRAGEIGYETDTGKFRVGDGTNVWSALSDPIPEGVLFADGHISMTGALVMGGNKITGLAQPEADTDAANKEYVDDVITIALVGNYIPTGQKGVANGVATLDANGKLTAAQKPAYTPGEIGAVPITRTVNGKALSADITLEYGDVGARPDTWTPTAADVGAVPITRTVNSKELSADITLTAADVGARAENWLPTTEEIDAVPITRTVNGKALSANIELTYTDVNARPDTWNPIAADVSFEAGDTGIVSQNVQDAIEEVQRNVRDIGDVVEALTPADIGALPVQTGSAGQLLGFTADNTVGAIDAAADNISFSAGDTGLAAEDVQSAIEALNTKMDGLTAADVGARSDTWLPTTEEINAVPITRTVNSKELSSDIVLTAADVGAVPTTRTVNGKALSEDISLNYSDVGARPDTWTPSAGDVTFTPGETGLEAVTVQAAIEEVLADSTLQEVTARGATTSNAVVFSNNTESTSTTTGAVTIAGGMGVAGAIWADQVYGAVWNDYAEYREVSGEFAPGDCVCEDELGILSKSTKRLQKNAHIISDTFGFAIGKTDEEQCPIALTGRVLASVTGHQLDYSVGDVVCAGADGKITKMRWWEKVLFPDRMIGVVSKIPDSNEWGKGIKVNDRVWVNIF